ncbi:MCP four helix bundle domain-containing protein [Spirosoma fluviale]|uniref:Four helix bundle sensory module for signal transduction n=1 Tax=Spirosoma fluviale TaxID=1597977 RepID=A0A286F8M3_9BACT|nr:MCP four helix bundle domain-containing protein [Spirosoma fluviale]SOD79561.1 Four helix bundle sensory module for signal transduction [Spirosoma fluviale]
MSQTHYNPLRSGLLVISLLGLILTSIFLSRRNTYKIQEDSVSIYKDRLVPTAILVNLMSTVYGKRMLLETQLLTKGKPDVGLGGSNMDQFNRRTDSLLTEFGRTKLTVKEADQLRLFKRQLSVYDRLEVDLATKFTSLSKDQQLQIARRASTAFGQTVQTLNELASLQLTVGEELLEESRGQTNDIYILTALQIGLVLFVGLSLYWHRF